MKTVLLAGIPEPLCGQLSRALRHRFRLRACGSSEEMVHMLDTFQPDVLIVHLAMTGALDALGQGPRKPSFVLALTPLASEPVLREAAAVGVQQIFLVPCPSRAILRALEAPTACG